MLLLFISTFLNFYTNEVIVKRADSIITPYISMELLDRDTIFVKDSSQAEILYPDSSTLFIDQNSTISITSSSKKRSVFLSLGKIWARVKGLLKGESFEINNPVSVSGIRGTEFIVTFKDDESEIKVLEGTVNVRELLTGDEALLERDRMARIKRGMAIQLMKFRSEDLECWNRWRESHLMFIIKKIEKALQRENILHASILIDQGYMLARRLGLMEEYKSKIDKFKEEYENIRNKKGMFKSKLHDIQYNLNKIYPVIHKMEPHIAELKGMLDQLIDLHKEAQEYIRENRKQEALHLLPTINRLMNQIESRINKFPKDILSKILNGTERDFSLICDIESKIPIDSDIRAEIMDMRINIKELRDRIRKQKNMLDKILNDYNRLKYSLIEIKRNL